MKKILVVDDDRKICLAIVVRLKAAGFEVNAAYDALTGLNTAMKFKPDLIILDISMPAGGGFSIAERIQNLAELAGTPFIMVTASKQPEHREKAAQLGAVGFLEKPYDAAELLAMVNSALGLGPK